MRVERTSFPEAVKAVLSTLEKGEAFSVTHLSRETGLNRRTVEKVLSLLCEVQKSLQDKRLDIIKANKTKIVQLKRSYGLLSLPENIQKLIVRAVYFPTPSREEELLVHLLLKEAWTPEKAIDLERTEIVEKLLTVLTDEPESLNHVLGREPLEVGGVCHDLMHALAA